MWLILALGWQCGVPARRCFYVLPIISRFGVFNSRLSPLRELAGKDLICLAVLRAKPRQFDDFPDYFPPKGTCRATDGRLGVGVRSELA